MLDDLLALEASSEDTESSFLSYLVSHQGWWRKLLDMTVLLEMTGCAAFTVSGHMESINLRKNKMQTNIFLHNVVQMCKDAVQSCLNHWKKYSHVVNYLSYPVVMCKWTPAIFYFPQ